MRYAPAATLAALILSPSFAWAQARSAPPTPTAAVDAAAVTRTAQDAAEDVALTRVLAALQLTQTQMSELLPSLEDAQNRLQSLDRENADAVARHKQALAEVRDQLVSGKAPSTRAE